MNTLYSIANERGMCLDILAEKTSDEIEGDAFALLDLLDIIQRVHDYYQNRLIFLFERKDD